MATVLKEGTLKKRTGNKKDHPSNNSKPWKSRYFILVDGALYYYETTTSETPNGVILLKNCKVEERMETESKKQFSFSLKTETQEVVIAAKSEEEKLEWIRMLRENVGKESISKEPERPKHKSLVYKAQKNIVEKTATSKMGKNILKEYLPDDTWYILEVLKRVVSDVSGPAQGKEIEKRILKTSIKTACLYKGKHINGDALLQTCKEPILKMWELFIDATDGKHQDLIPDLSKSILLCSVTFESVLKPHLTPKTIQKMKETMEYFANTDTLPLLLSDPKHTEELRKVSNKLKILKSLFLWLGQ